MGQACSGGTVNKDVNATRDPADQELDAIEMKETKIPDFDSFFERAAGPLNELVEIHNGIYLSEENLKEAGAAMQGEVQIRLEVGPSGQVSLNFWRFNEKDEEIDLTPSEVEAKLNASEGLREAYQRTTLAIDHLNESISQPSNARPSRYEVKIGRLYVTSKGAQNDLVRSTNIALFSLRKELALLSHITTLSKAMRIFLKELSKVEDLSTLHVETDDKGAMKLMAEDREVNLKKIDKLSKPAKKFRDALVDLMENMETAATSVPELAEQTDAFVTEAQDFPAKVPEAASSSGLGFSDIPKALKATSSNVKSLSNGPRIASATTDIIQHAAREIADAIRSPIGA